MTHPVVQLNLAKKTTDSIKFEQVILNPKEYHLIQQIQDALAEGCSKREVALLGIGRQTVVKYATGNPKTLSELDIQSGQLGQYLEDCLL